MTEQEIDKFVEDLFTAIKNLDGIGKLADARRILHRKDPNLEYSKYSRGLIFTYMMTALSAYLVAFEHGSAGFTRQGAQEVFTRMLQAIELARERNA